MAKPRTSNPRRTTGMHGRVVYQIYNFLIGTQSIKPPSSFKKDPIFQKKGPPKDFRNTKAHKNSKKIPRKKILSKLKNYIKRYLTCFQFRKPIVLTFSGGGKSREPFSCYTRWRKVTNNQARSCCGAPGDFPLGSPFRLSAG